MFLSCLFSNVLWRAIRTANKAFLVLIAHFTIK